jgi:hypothetical protein
MPSYLLLIVGDDDAYEALDEEQSKDMYAGHGAFMEALAAAGVKLGPSAELSAASGARTLRADGVVTDGPFAESKEQVGGFYSIDVPTIDDAIEWARKIPLLPGDKIEVRQQR